MSQRSYEVTGRLVTIGDEILLGDIANGNAHHIARELRARGFRLGRIVTVGDSEEEIVELLCQCLSDSDFLIVTGGLGPTDDDKTNSAVSRAFGRPLVANRDYARWLKTHLGGTGIETVKGVDRMAALPDGAVKLGMDMAGFFLLHENIPCYFLPGVPNEMKHLLANSVIPDLESRFPNRCAYLKHVVRVQGLVEAEVNERLQDLDSQRMGVDIGYLPQGRENWVTIFASAPNAEECGRLVKRARDQVVALIGPRHISGHNEDCLERVIGRYLRDQGWRISVAESCTGGLVASKITAVAGASDYLERAFVTYSNRSKSELLGVPEGLLETAGAVSEQAATAMAEGARSRSGVEVGLAVTGIAGPSGGSDEKPVGTVWIACVTPKKKAVHRYAFGGSREQVQESAAQAALALLWRLLSDDSELHCD